MALVKAFLKAGILTELGGHEDTLAGTPQGGILSPLIANITCRRWTSTSPARGRQRWRHGQHGRASGVVVALPTA
jgi:retron-type reverse transcriptase